MILFDVAAIVQKCVRSKFFENAKISSLVLNTLNRLLTACTLSKLNGGAADLYSKVPTPFRMEFQLPVERIHAL